MVIRRPFLDVIPDAQAATSAQLTQADRPEWGTVTATPESDVSVPAGRLEVAIDGSDLPPVVVPADGGITAVGAKVMLVRDSSGRVVRASTPARLPAGAVPVAVGVTGEWLAGLDAVSAAQQAALDAAREDLDAARAALDDPDTGLEATQQKADRAVSDAAQALEQGVVSVVTEYAAGSSETVAPPSGWSTTAPARTPGSFIWSRSTTTTGDGTATTGTPVLVTGNTGATGAAGAAGKGVQSSAIAYQLSASGTTTPTGSWVSSPPAQTTALPYLWTRITLTYTDATTSVAYSVGKLGATGADGATGATGAAGVSVSSITPYYLQTAVDAATPAKPTANPPGGSWSPTEPGWTSSTALWRTELVLLSSGSFAYTAVSKVSSYTASAQAMTAVNLVDAAQKGLVKASATDPGQQVGRIWLVLNSSGQCIGVKVSNGSAWTSYALVADQILVPSSVGTVSLAAGAITAPKITASDELWAKLASFAKVTTDMLIAGGAVITGDMIVDNLVGKNLYGAYIGGGELLIQGESAAPPTTGVITRFETSGDDQLWANTFDSTGVSRVTGGRSGYMLQSVAAPDDGNVQNWVNTRYNNSLSPWVSAINSIPLAGSTTLSVWVKSSVADTLSVSWFRWLNANGDKTAVVKRNVDVAANTWTEVTLTGPAGYRPVIDLLGMFPLVTIFGTKVSSTQSRTLWVDDLTWSNKLATSSSLHLFRDASGTPTIQVTGGDSESGVITLSAPTGDMAQLEFATADGTSSTKMTASGITRTSSGRTEVASWTGVADTVSPILIKTTPKDIASGSYTDWFDIPYGATFEEPPLLEGYLASSGDIVKARVLPYGATASKFNLRVYNDGTQNKTGVIAWIIVRPVRSFKITSM